MTDPAQIEAVAIALYESAVRRSSRPDDAFAYGVEAAASVTISRSRMDHWQNLSLEARNAWRNDAYNLISEGADWLRIIEADPPSPTPP